MIQPTLLREATAAFSAERAARDRLATAVRNAFPVGTYVEVPLGSGVVRGVVAQHSMSLARAADLRVRLSSTGRLMWVSVYPLLQETA